jgi:hypothetical protein
VNFSIKAVLKSLSADDRKRQQIELANSLLDFASAEDENRSEGTASLEASAAFSRERRCSAPGAYRM